MGGFCPGEGACPGGFCPRTISPIGFIEHFTVKLSNALSVPLQNVIRFF